MPAVDPLARARTLTVADARPLARDVVGFDLVDPAGARLPPFRAGAHVALETPAGLVRRYSLLNDPGETNHYAIAVKRVAGSRGGSASMVERLKAGDTIRVSTPRNQFALDAKAPRFLFLAGGIGITPILAMMRELDAAGRTDWRLVYCTRSPEDTPFADLLAAEPFAGRVRIHHDGGDPARAFDFWPLLESPTRAHVYCCGPRAMMDAVRDMSGHWPFGSVHFESFGVDAALRQADRPFDVKLAKSGRTLHVPADRSILEVLRADGVAMRSSCEAGSCGSCRTGLVEGDIDHRDFVLGESERASQIMVCVSRARSGTPVLDL
jgi:phthalate 4,5-dioxygenase reductase subunit